jgi:CRISPR/Cas system CMR subunit Cmr4 (Cas7 group RAMP superfamily)
LLDGQTLNYQEDRRLIELLLNLNVSVARHNDFVQMTNQAQATIPVPDNIHAQWFRDIQERTAAVAAVRDEILKDLNRKK